MNILLIDTLPALAGALREQGHRVVTLGLGGGLFPLPRHLERLGFTPDLVVQQEQLGPRAFYAGLEEMPCPTVFWALDSHLNLFWHQWYGRLFDAVISPHVSLFTALPDLLRPPRLERFAWPGSARPFSPHAGRGRFLSLCARVDGHRQIRGWLIDLLRPAGLYVTDGLGHAEMMRLYDDSRVVPNESIAHEVNFRLMEAASSGCLLLTPDVGEDQEALLAPGEECLVYHDGLELLDQAVWAKKYPDQAERIGLAAWRRVRTGHLPVHRAEFLVGLGRSLTRARLEGRAAVAALWLTLARHIRNGTAGIDARSHAGEGLPLARELSGSDKALDRLFGTEIMAQAICLLAEKAGGVPAGERAFLLCRELLEGWRDRNSGEGPAGRFAGQPDLATASACSAFALSQGETAMARACYLVHTGPDAALVHTGPDAARLVPRDPVGLCLAWAARFRGRGPCYLSGFRYRPEQGMLPDNALAWLLFAAHLEPGNRAVTAAAAQLLEDVPAYLSLYLGYAARLCLENPEDWRTQQDYGLACLRACRVEAGLFELDQAREKAREKGRERLYQARLRARAGERADALRLEIP